MLRFHVLIHNIPPKPLYLRAKIRQRLAQVGAIALKNSVYVLPANDDTLEDFQWIAQEVVAGGGTAHILEATFVAPEEGEIVSAFQQERDAEYADVIVEARDARKRGRAEDAAAVAARLAKRLEDIRRIDFFSASKAADAEKAVALLGQRVKRKESPSMLKASSEVTGRTWTTRPGVKIDRIASAWLIRRFIDPKAKFRFAPATAAREEGEVRFDMVGGDFTHEGDRCTFETLASAHGIRDRGVKAIAEIVHDLDLKDAKYGRAEAAGVARMLEGLLARSAGDEERLERGFALFDDLHEALLPRKAR
ncbi:MAG TPA: chromate resistance protein ChrB domain-containing protein [Thermoanaerobaculia bacterium]|nr:chromate resistance protein ChrB domain-containing protein [Thermoanaerobaculia bacterium]